MVVLLCLLATVAAAGWFLQRLFPPGPPRTSGSPARASAGGNPQELAEQVVALERREAAMAEEFWAPELLAQRHARVFEELWNELNSAPDDWAVLARFAVETVLLPRPAVVETLPHGIRVSRGGDRRQLDFAEWRVWLAARAVEGWELGPIEFRHLAFDPASGSAPARSRFGFRAHLRRPDPEERALLTGDFEVTWSVTESPEALPRVAGIDAGGVGLKRRAGPPPFREILNTRITPPEKSFFIDPLIARDLNGNGRPELILGSVNRVFELAPEGWREGRLVEGEVGATFTSVIGDFDGDAVDDLLVARFEGLVLFAGSSGGGVGGAGRPAWPAASRLRYAQVLTTGDVDGDGDLDVWLGQYKGPYNQGQMPAPYYDANDGNPSWLLLNDGQGRFADVTEAAGLVSKRWRRTYSASLVDLDDDRDLDLLVVSDFAGLDVHLNDGHGHFRDVTRERVDEPHGFGMAHVLADFNRDGRADLLMTGMHCPTAWRLDHLGLTRPEHPDYARARARMTSGCRLYFGQPDGRLAQGPAGAALARAGWTWGCVAFDLENDGWLDIYAANGHETKAWVQDYEPEFWLHDIYVADSRDDPVTAAYFGGKISRTRGQGMSYGGYEKNRCYVNLAGAGFAEIGWLLGVALPEDSRNVVATDLDADGRQDLAVTTFEAWPEVRQTLRVFRNELPDPGNWIAFRLQRSGATDGPEGAVVTLRGAGRADRRWIVTGDSHRSQQAPVAHFGLGSADAVDSVQVAYSSGEIQIIEGPAINRTHTLSRGPGAGTDVGVE
ncbi:MAG: CRTAC1 family protein [Verrucomicrobiales bacterium]|nr:CRTAC1 family protein [Verrucomicrobiales bacterium]